MHLQHLKWTKSHSEGVLMDISTLFIHYTYGKHHDDHKTTFAVIMNRKRGKSTDETNLVNNGFSVNHANEPQDAQYPGT